MNSQPTGIPDDLPPAIRSLLTGLVAAAQTSFAEDLVSVILFGSGAEGRLRATSDLNLLIVLRRFERGQVDAFREPLRLAAVAARATAMFVLESELPQAAQSFAAKFDDILRRRRVLAGTDAIAGLSIPPDVRRRRLRQMLLNLQLRLRERYAALSLREEQLALAVADAAGPLRAAAASLLELEGVSPPPPPREALAQVARAECAAEADALLAEVSQVRDAGVLPPGEAGAAAFRLLALNEAMLRRLARLG